MKRNWLFRTVLLCALLCLLTVGAGAANVVAEGVCGEGTTWTLTDDGLLSVGGTGPMADYDSWWVSPPWYDYRDLIEQVVIQPGVTTVGGSAFRNCAALTRVEFPEGLGSIGAGAFSDCSALPEVVLPASLTALGEEAFARCTAAGRVVLSPALTDIGPAVFWNCRALEELVIPASLRFVGENAFYGCEGLTLACYDGSYAQTYADYFDIPRRSLGALPYAQSPYRVSGALDMEKLSPARIADLFTPYDLSGLSSLYVEAPSLSAPYAGGVLREEVLQSGLTHINAIRRLAGLGSVTLNRTMSQHAQDAALINAVNGHLSHYPARPAGMDDALYNSGYTGAGRSNLSMGYGSLVAAIDGCMEDEDPSNIARVGHRRWFLSTELGQIGFGQVGRSYAHYVFDWSAQVPAYDFVSWPASGSFPSGQFNALVPWSVSLNPDRYKAPSLSTVTVTLTERSTGKSWSFSGEKTYSEYDREYFNVETGGYGSGPAIIFRPDGISRYEGLYTVTVGGLTDANGIPVELSYYVNFFDEDETDPDAESGFITEGLFWQRGEDGTLSVTGVSETAGKLVLAVYRGGKMTAVDMTDCGELDFVTLTCSCPDGAEVKLFRLDGELSARTIPWQCEF